MNGFSHVSYKTRIFEREFTEERVTSDVVDFKRTTILAFSVTPIKYYRVNGEEYLYFSDKSLRKRSNNSFSSVGFTGNVAPLITPVIRSGVRKTMYINDQTAKIGTETVSGVPYGTDCAFCAGRLFIAYGKEIKFSAEFDFTDFNVGLDFGGFVRVEEDDGNVLCLAESGGKLYAICEHAAFVISPYGEEYDFTMERISSFALNVVSGTAFQAGNRICFISGKELCIMTDGKIKRVGKTLLSSLDFTPNGAACGGNGLYVLPLTVGQDGYLYVYDTVTEKEMIKPLGTFTASGLYAVKRGDYYLYELTVGKSTETVAPSYSGEYDFGSCANKSVCRVEVHISGSAELVVTGDGVYRAVVTEKCNSVSCFVHGRSFTIGFENASEDFKVYKIAVHYINYGE